MTQQPILPLPEILGRFPEGWQVKEGPPETSLRRRIMSAPGSDVCPDCGQLHGLAARTHEMAHATWSPVEIGSSAKKEATRWALKTAEEMRVNLMLAGVGIPRNALGCNSQVYETAVTYGLAALEREIPLEMITLAVATHGTDDWQPFFEGAQSIDHEYAKWLTEVAETCRDKFTSKRRKVKLHSRATLDVAKYLDTLVKAPDEDGEEEDPEGEPGGEGEEGEKSKRDESRPGEGSAKPKDAKPKERPPEKSFDDREAPEPKGATYRPPMRTFSRYDTRDAIDPVEVLARKEPVEVRDALDKELNVPSHWPINRPSGLNRWGVPTFSDPPRLQRLTGTLRGLGPRPSDCGDVPQYMNRWTIDRRIWRQKRRKQGVSILIDMSGSMGFDVAEIDAVMTRLPGSIIAGYAGSGANGTLRVIAKNGSRVIDDLVDVPGGLNCIDGPCLEWLGKQPAPRLWVSDGGVSGPYDSFRAWNEWDARRIMRRHRIKLISKKTALSGSLTKIARLR